MMFDENRCNDRRALLQSLSFANCFTHNLSQTVMSTLEKKYTYKRKQSQKSSVHRLTQCPLIVSTYDYLNCRRHIGHTNHRPFVFRPDPRASNVYVSYTCIICTYTWDAGGGRVMQVPLP